MWESVPALDCQKCPQPLNHFSFIMLQTHTQYDIIVNILNLLYQCYNRIKNATENKEKFEWL